MREIKKGNNMIKDVRTFSILKNIKIENIRNVFRKQIDIRNL